MLCAVSNCYLLHVSIHSLGVSSWHSKAQSTVCPRVHPTTIILTDWQWASVTEYVIFCWPSEGDDVITVTNGEFTWDTGAPATLEE